MHREFAILKLLIPPNLLPAPIPFCQQEVIKGVAWLKRKTVYTVFHQVRKVIILYGILHFFFVVVAFAVVFDFVFGLSSDFVVVALLVTTAADVVLFVLVTNVLGVVVVDVGVELDLDDVGGFL